MARAYLGLGTNLGQRVDNLTGAVRALGQLGDVVGQSSIYETPPLYVTDQPSFLNMAVALDTQLPPLHLLAALKNLESELGRVESIRFGPRQIDLDILIYDDVQMRHPDLEVPHPRLAERRFALAPLADIAPDLVHPVLGRTVRQLLATTGDQSQITLFAPPLLPFK